MPIVKILRNNLPVIAMILVLLSIVVVPATAQMISWTKNDVTPIVLVKPSYSGFVPTQGNTYGIVWTKDQVVPMIIVKRNYLNRFEPLDGGYLHNWSKSEVTPIVYVVQTGYGFIPEK